MKMRIISAALLAVPLASCGTPQESGDLAMEPVARTARVEPRRRPEADAPSPSTVDIEPSWRDELKERLGQRHTIEFTGEDLAAALRRLSVSGKINIVLDGLAREKYGSVEVAFDVEDTSLRSILSRVLEKTGLTYDFVEYAVFVGEQRWCSSVKRREAERRARAERADVPEAERAMRGRLARSVCFEMIDTPLREALPFLESVAGIEMELDPSVKDYRDVPVNLTTVSAMPLENAIEWLLRDGGLGYEFRGERIFISTPEKLLRDR